MLLYQRGPAELLHPPMLGLAYIAPAALAALTAQHPERLPRGVRGWGAPDGGRGVAPGLVLCCCGVATAEWWLSQPVSQRMCASHPYGARS